MLRLNLSQVARHLGVATTALETLIKDGLLDAVQPGRAHHYRLDAVVVQKLADELGEPLAGDTTRLRGLRLREILVRALVKRTPSAPLTEPPQQQPLPIHAPIPVTTGRAAARALGVNPARISEAIEDGTLTNLNPVPGAKRAIPVAQVEDLEQRLAARRATAAHRGEGNMEAAVALMQMALTLMGGGKP